MLFAIEILPEATLTRDAVIYIYNTIRFQFSEIIKSVHFLSVCLCLLYRVLSAITIFYQNCNIYYFVVFEIHLLNGNRIFKM